MNLNEMKEERAHRGSKKKNSKRTKNFFFYFLKKKKFQKWNHKCIVYISQNLEKADNRTFM